MKSTFYASALRRAAAVSFAVAVGFGSLLTPLAAQAETPVASVVQLSPSTAVQPLAAWVPYDNSAITTAAGCERRRTWLIANVNWITQTNSACFKYVQPGCPTAQRTGWSW